jgi:hypothetical protein
VFWYSLQLLSEIFLILRRIQRHVIVNLYRYLCIEPVMLVRFQWELNISIDFIKALDYEISWNSLSGSRLVPWGQTDTHRLHRDMKNLKFSLCVQKNKTLLPKTFRFYCSSCLSSETKPMPYLPPYALLLSGFFPLLRHLPKFVILKSVTCYKRQVSYFGAHWLVCGPHAVDMMDCFAPEVRPLSRHGEATPAEWQGSLV